MEVSASLNWTYQNDAHEYVIGKCVCVTTHNPHILISKWHRKWKYLEKERSHIYICVCKATTYILKLICYLMQSMLPNVSCSSSSIFILSLFFHFYFLFLNRNRRRANMSWSKFSCVCVWVCTLRRCHRQDFLFQFPVSEGLQIKCTRLCIASITIWIPDYPESVHQCGEHRTWEHSLHPTSNTLTQTQTNIPKM